MSSRSWVPGVAFALVSLAGACGGDGSEAARGTYERFEVTVRSPTPGAPFTAGQDLLYELHYRGVLARNLTLTAVMTHEDTGAEQRRALVVGGPNSDSSVHNYTSKWKVKDDFLKKAGRFRLRLEAAITSTLRGSLPWTTASADVPLTSRSTLDAIRLVTPAGSAPIAYGTPMEVEVDGQDLWDDVVLTAVDSADMTVPALEHPVPFAIGQTTAHATWSISARPLEVIGDHPLRLIARFGSLTAQSEPFTLVVTHTVDDVQIFARDATGNLTEASSKTLELPKVKDLVVRARGTKLAGHEVTVNGTNPFVAAADEVEVVKVPNQGDFPKGIGKQTYSFAFKSGGVERASSTVIQRWAISDCAWYSAETKRLADDALIQPGTDVFMRAATWGFPDTKTTFGVLKDREANFAIWESDSGRDLLFGPGDDEVDDFDAEIKGNGTAHSWKAEFVEESTLPLPTGFPQLSVEAELFFKVAVEDQTCVSPIMRVPHGK